MSWVKLKFKIIENLILYKLCSIIVPGTLSFFLKKMFENISKYFLKSFNLIFFELESRDVEKI